MLKFIILSVVTLGLLLSVSAEAQQVQYVGNSDGTDTNRRGGGAGILKFNEECVETFGAGARVCSSLEILQSTVEPASDPTNVRQWVVPAIVAGGTSGVDATGLAGSALLLSCNGWSSSSSTAKGLTIDDDGKFSLQACNGPRQIACCQAP